MFVRASEDHSLPTKNFESSGLKSEPYHYNIPHFGRPKLGLHPVFIMAVFWSGMHSMYDRRSSKSEDCRYGILVINFSDRRLPNFA